MWKQRKEYFREYCQKNRQRRLEYGREYRQKNKARFKVENQELKLKVLSYYGIDGIVQCHCCGESRMEFLTLDHIYGDGSKHRKLIGSGAKVYRWIVKNNFPTGFRTLCLNCNFSLGKYGYCPHHNGLKVERGDLAKEFPPLFAKILSQEN